MARLYADENFRYPVVEALRQLGHDVLTAQEAGRAGQGIDDDTVLADAASAGRVLLTQNRRDFIRRHNLGALHRGIIVCTYDPDAVGLAARIDAAVAAADPAGGWLLRVNRPPRGAATMRVLSRSEMLGAFAARIDDQLRTATPIEMSHHGPGGGRKNASGKGACSAPSRRRPG